MAQRVTELAVTASELANKYLATLPVICVLANSGHSQKWYRNAIRGRGPAYLAVL